MSKFSKGKKRKEPAISTASLPDIVFMLLFFFMVTTTSKEPERPIIVKKATASAVTKLQKADNLIFNYWIGKPLDKNKGTSTRVFLDDQFVPNMSYIRTYLKDKREGNKEIWNSRAYNNFKVDVETEMRVVKGVQDELREQDALKVIYSVNEAR
ncbi:MAG: biopolymer transporter ExbD [Flavobacteriales bacterium]|jgi:hypothetical protein|nr:biopolymer transporter ExbD [Flavobacteriales bacterium]